MVSLCTSEKTKQNFLLKVLPETSHQKICLPPANVMVFLPPENRAASHVTRQCQSNGFGDRTNRTQFNAIEWLKFDCRTQSNLNRILPRFSDSIEIRLRFHCVRLVRLRFDCVRLTSSGAQYFQATYQRHPVYQKALVVI